MRKTDSCTELSAALEGQRVQRLTQIWVSLRAVTSSMMPYLDVTGIGAAKQTHCLPSEADRTPPTCQDLFTDQTDSPGSGRPSLRVCVCTAGERRNICHPVDTFTQSASWCREGGASASPVELHRENVFYQTHFFCFFELSRACFFSRSCATCQPSVETAVDILPGSKMEAGI